MRDDVVRLYGEGHAIRAIATELGMHHREVWRQLAAAGVARRARGTSGVVLSRRWSVSTSTNSSRSPSGPPVRSLDPSGRPDVRSYGLPRRDRHAPLDRDTLRRLYVDERLGIRAVAVWLGVSADKVRADLARHRVPIRPPGQPARTGS